MLPELARRAIENYSDPGDLVLDPMCGIGTTLVEAIHLGRHALGVELEPRWVDLTAANLVHAHDQGAHGRAGVLVGDATELPRLLAADARPFLRQLEPVDAIDVHPCGRIDMILTSPPYACEVGELDKQAWRLRRGRLDRLQTRNYSPDRANLGHARKRRYLAAMAASYAADAAVLKPGGFLVVVTKNLRLHGALNDLAGQTIVLCRRAGLCYWQHVIAVLATLEDGELIARPSFWQLLQTRRARARGDRTQLVGHEDVLVFRKPIRATAGGGQRERAEVARETRR
jgi:SAM-dependent methyltransferase